MRSCFGSKPLYSSDTTAGLLTTARRMAFVDCLLKVLVLLCLGSGQLQPAMASNSNPVCVVKGKVYTEMNWYGYLVKKPFHRDWAKIQYQISYPVKECCVKLLIYYDDQIKQLEKEMTCSEREQILPTNNNQIIPLYANNRTVGCSVWNDSGDPFYVCLGERIFRSSGPRTWYFAISRCGAAKNSILNLNYVFNISGYYGPCETDVLAETCVQEAPETDKFLYVAVALGIVAGIALLLAAIFFTLWLQDKRRSNNKGSSVTSSQATMTQDDVFYVNPSLSDREQTDYSQSSSENYYEVIPERRSYESINTHLAVPGHGHGHGGARHATQVKDMRPFHPQFIFDDYPPPPYQPPRGMGVPKHHTLHHPPHHHHHHLVHSHPHSHAHSHGQQQSPLGLHHSLGHHPRERSTLATHSETSA